MIVKNCAGVTCLETCQREVVGETDFCSLNIKLSTDTITCPSVHESNKEQGSNKNSSLDLSLLHPQLRKDSEKMSDISVKVIEKLSELSLEDSKGTNKSAIEVDKNVLKGKSVVTCQKDNDQKAPVATISVKEKDKETLCLSCLTGNVCNETSKLCPNEKLHSKNQKKLPSNILLIERGPTKNERVHCKTSVTRFPYQQQLHGCGGTFKEIIPSVNAGANLNVIDKEYYIAGLLSPPPESNTSSVCDQFPSSPFNLSSSSSLDAGSPLPNIASLFPTPPHENTFSPFSEVQYSPTSEIQYSSVFDELNALSPASSEQEKINDIHKYLLSGDIDPAIAEIVKNLENNINSSSFESNSASFSGSEKVIYNVNSSRVSNYTFSDTSLASQAVIFVPAQMQTVTMVSEDRRNQMTLKQRPILPKTEISNREPEKQPEQKAQNKPVCSKRSKSVKSEICSRFFPDEKKQFFKEISLMEKKPSNDGRTTLHLAVLEGNEKLAYAVIESTKIFKRNSNLCSETNLRKEMQIFVNKQDVYGCTALYYAVLGNNELLTAYLLECGGDPFIKDYEIGNTAFHVITIKGDGGITMFDLLSYRRNNIEDLQNNKGQTILSAAILNHGRLYNGIQINGIKLIKHLLRNNHKASIRDSEGRTALHLAVRKKDIEVLEVLLICPVDAWNAKMVQDNEGNTILHYAAMLVNIESNSHKRLINMINTHCSDLTTVKNKKGQLPHEIINENKKQVKQLLKCSMDEYGYRDL